MKYLTRFVVSSVISSVIFLAPVVPAQAVMTTENSAVISQLQAQITALLNLIQTLQAQLNAIVAKNSTGSNVGTGTGTVTVPPATTSGDVLCFGSGGMYSTMSQQVYDLQKKIKMIGAYDGPLTGYLGGQTQDALKAFQRSNGISDTGCFGPITRAALEKAVGALSNNSGSTGLNGSNGSQGSVTCPSGQVTNDGSTCVPCQTGQSVINNQCQWPATPPPPSYTADETARCNDPVTNGSYPIYYKICPDGTTGLILMGSTWIHVRNTSPAL